MPTLVVYGRAMHRENSRKRLVGAASISTGRSLPPLDPCFESIDSFRQILIAAFAANIEGSVI